MDVHWTSTEATKESQFRFFLELTKKIPSLHLAHKWNSFFLKHQFWCVHEWYCTTHVWSLVSDDLFWSLKAVLLKEAKRPYFFVVYHIYNGTCPQKKLKCQLIVAFEKQTLKWQWKEDKIICGKANSYFRRLSGPFRKNEEISKVVYFFSFGLKLKMKLVETVSVTIGVKFRQTSYASKTN